LILCAYIHARARTERFFFFAFFFLFLSVADDSVRSLCVQTNKQINNSPENNWKDIFNDQTAYVYEPKSRSTTWGFVHFLGGAVLGQFPQVCYDEFLSSVSESTGVTVVATPYELGTKHGKMAKKCKRAFEKARAAVQERDGLDGKNVPVFYVGHSLGAKLHAVANFDGYDEEGASESTDSGSYSKQHFLVAFNNASATDSVKILEKFAKELLSKREGGGDAASSQFDAIFDRLVPFAEVAAKAAGLEFAPNALETLNGVANGKFKSDKVTLLSFTNDELDQCSSLREALADGEVRTNSVEIPGDHLSPVMLDLDKYAKMNPVMNRLSGVRIGDREAVEKIANEMVKFLKS